MEMFFVLVYIHLKANPDTDAENIREYSQTMGADSSRATKVDHGEFSHRSYLGYKSSKNHSERDKENFYHWFCCQVK